MEIRRSKALDKMRNGEVVLSTKVNIADSRVIEIAGLSGIDCIWTDMEHVGNDFAEIEKQILATKAYGMDIMVRVQRGCYSNLIRPLELDASGIMVPHIMSLEDAKKVVYMTKFHPIGRRPIDGGNADGGFGYVSLDDYLTQSNERKFVCVQIEDPEPMAELDEIAALDGIDMLFFGPADFSHGIGAPGQFDHPELLDARRKVAQAARRHGKFAGTVGAASQLGDLVKMGYSYINIGADVSALRRHFSGIVNDFNEAMKNV